MREQLFFDFIYSIHVISNVLNSCVKRYFSDFDGTRNEIAVDVGELVDVGPLNGDESSSQIAFERSPASTSTRFGIN